MKATLTRAEVRRAIVRHLEPTQAKMQAIADKALEQVKERFATAGASGGDPWPPTKTPLGHEPPLSGLEKTWDARASYGEAVVASDSWLCLVHHLGTKGRGGQLDTIVPRFALKLFVPLTEKGRAHYAAFKSRAPVIRRVFAGTSTLETPKFKTRTDDAKYGVDFLLLDHVDLPPRRQIPSSSGERAELARFAIKALMH